MRKEIDLDDFMVGGSQTTTAQAVGDDFERWYTTHQQPYKLHGVTGLYEAWQAARAKYSVDLDNEALIDVVAEKQANGWEYGTHPRDKAKIVLNAIREHFGVKA